MRSKKSRTSSVLILSTWLIFVSLEYVSGAEVCVELVARFAQSAPDGVRKEIITLNGQFPGPTIRGRIGDVFTIRVRNNLRANHSTSVHFHGIEMPYTPWFDGPEQVTQCPIPFGGFMDYKFKVYQSGTYWYHSHHSWQYVDGFWGLLIIDNVREVYAYNKELTLTLMDWHWRSGQVLSDLLHLPQSDTNPEAGRTPVPDSALINGYGNANCDEATAYQCNTQAANVATVINVQEGLTYRIRLANPSARAAFNFSIDGHFLRTIEVDGVDTVEVDPADVVTIWPAQRYSFLVTMNRRFVGGESGNVRIRADMIVGGAPDPAKLARIQPLAVLHYEGNSWSPQRPGPGFASTDSGDGGFQATGFGGEGGRETLASSGGGSQGRLPFLRPWNTTVSDSPISNSAFFARGVSITIRDVEDLSGAEEALRAPGRCVFTRPTDNLNNNPQSRVNKEYLSVVSTRRPNPILLDQMKCRSSDSLNAPTTYDEQVVLNAKFFIDSSRRFKGHINDNAYDTSVSQVPAIFRAMADQTVPPTFNPQLTSNFRMVIQLVINNLNGSHPWHLHGHTFWVLGTGQPGDGPYNPARDSSKLTISGVRRDTTHTFPNSWTVIRYYANNPGVWLLHCHIHWHLEIGLAAIFIEDTFELQNYLQVPDEARRVCRLNGIVIPRS